ncbi:hypothetical protein L484_005691 [Morus notabilis]|uniref:Uncharacterized protein n=1 Tax=Morus notabilis TaxID=981085 RepID=W9S9P3_9ROSA|nr:hypothetical protein L484_005691 [Morus notabilis]
MRLVVVVVELASTLTNFGLRRRREYTFFDKTTSQDESGCEQRRRVPRLGLFSSSSTESPAGWICPPYLDLTTDGGRWFFSARLHHQIRLLRTTLPLIWWILCSSSPCAGGQWLAVVFRHICDDKIAANTGGWSPNTNLVSQLDTHFVVGTDRVSRLDTDIIS